MNCFNGERYLREAIDSVYAQTHKDWEIILWDDASMDGTPDIANSYDEKLKYFRGEKAIALGQARNWAIEKAIGDYIAFLDQDDVWLPNKLEKQIPLFRNKRVGLVFCDTYFFSNKGIFRQLYAKRKPPRGHVFRYLLSNYFLSLETVVILKSALQTLPEWFDPRFNMVEEADLFLRIARDWELDYVDEPLSKWRLHSANWTFATKHLFPVEREMLLEKFSRLYPDFQTTYHAEVARIKAKNQYQFALLDWEKGDAGSVRGRLGQYLWHQKRYLFPYLMSFLPYRLYNWLLGLRSKGWH